ncbi:Uncharacterized protein Adt_18372 [Abeliophyllum distichum]|uniref:Uncharacterized protein n=1 Tax=Abeliophyllum distichum TaxID=126358 RepID=A0ABD1TJ71_9LAMI
MASFFILGNWQFALGDSRRDCVVPARYHKLKEVKSEWPRSEEANKSLAEERVHVDGMVAQWKTSPTFAAMQHEIYCDNLDNVAAFIEEKRPELDIDFLRETVRE